MPLKLWTLWLVLATGEAGPLATTESFCRGVQSIKEAGGEVKVDLSDGRLQVPVLAAVCLGPAAPAVPIQREGS